MAASPSSEKTLRAEVALLQRQVAELQQEKVDLGILVEMNVNHQPGRTTFSAWLPILPAESHERHA